MATFAAPEKIAGLNSRINAVAGRRAFLRVRYQATLARRGSFQFGRTKWQV